MDLIIKNARLADRPARRRAISAVEDGRIAAIAPSLPDAGETYDAGGRLVCAGLIETHIHLDKSRIVGRCPPPDGRRVNPVTMTAPLKKDFTVEDVYRARRGDLARMPRQRHDAHAHPARNRPRRRIARLRGGAHRWPPITNGRSTSKSASSRRTG